MQLSLQSSAPLAPFRGEGLGVRGRSVSGNNQVGAPDSSLNSRKGAKAQRVSFFDRGPGVSPGVLPFRAGRPSHVFIDLINNQNQNVSC